LKANAAAALLDKVITADNAAQVADSIVSLASDTDTISEDAAEKMAQAIENATNIFGKDNKPSDDTISSFLDAADNLLGVADTKHTNQVTN
jgi:hypothetical protein